MQVQQGQPEVKLLGNPPMATKVGNKNPWLECNTFLESKGHAVVIRRQPEGNCLEMLKATKCGQCRFRAYAATGALVSIVYNDIGPTTGHDGG